MSSSIALSFQNTTFHIIDHNSQPWLRGTQIGDALGYTKGRISIDKIYKSNQDEFNESMTALVELDTEGGKQQVRIFSLRGCHLLAMFSRTKIAKEFRKWVLDVLDQQAKLQEPRYIGPQDVLIHVTKNELADIIDQKIKLYHEQQEKQELTAMIDQRVKQVPIQLEGNIIMEVRPL